MTLHLFNQKGIAKAGGSSDNLIDEWSFADNLDNSEFGKAHYHGNPPNVYGFGHTLLYANVIDAIKTGRQSYVTGEDGKRALELVLAINKSAAYRKPVKLPLEKCSTLVFVGRFDK